MHKKSFMRAGVGCLSVIAGLSAATAPALAKAAPPATGAAYRPAHAPAVSSGNLSPLTTVIPTSAYLGGYDVPDYGSVSVTSTIQLPTAKCANRNDLEDIFLGDLLVPSGGDTYQGGSNDGSANVVMYCDGSSSTPTYYLEAYTAGGGDSSGDPASPGDLVQFTFSDNHGGTDSATTTDLNTGQSETSSGASPGDDTQVYQGAIPNTYYEEDGGVVDMAIPKFTTLKFDNAIIDGRPWTVTRPAPYSLQQNSDVQIKSTAVPTKSTYDFTLTEAHTS
ncbi:MAG TPA: G1 family glutamic endopeptidase [Solirubrobacteraceae bacterium]|nr:G1 family glutamic endopeptidase [Solirubrobacteraceae bacterium]